MGREAEDKNNYDFLLMDADGTLMDFERAETCAIEETMIRHGLPFSPEILALYSGINKKCWEEFERGEITKQTLLVERFRRLFERLHVTADPAVVRLTYQAELGKGAYMLPGAKELCRRLSRTHKLYILTNGVSATQHSRFALCGLDKLADAVFVSEDLGSQKPARDYFERVFARIPGFSRERALMVGDSLTSDIQGGINAGVDTCWYNPGGIPRPREMDITYEIRRLRELEAIV